jgi:hypothetical protein
MRRINFMAGIALLGLLGLVFITALHAQEPIKLGVLQPLSGGLEVLG